jgi:hypothetical protein
LGVSGFGRVWPGTMAWFLLEEGYEAGDIVFGRRGWVDVNLCSTVSFSGGVPRHMSDRCTDLALGVEELDTPSRLGMCDSVVFALFVIAHSIEAPRW